MIAQRYANSCPRGHDTSEDRSVEGILELFAFLHKLNGLLINFIELVPVKFKTEHFALIFGLCN